MSALRIAGIAFDVVSSDVGLDDGAEPAYLGFRGAVGRGDDVVPVEVRCEPVPVVGRSLFDADQTWSALALDDGDKALAFRGRHETAPLLARFDPLMTRIAISCSPDLCEDGRLHNPLSYPVDQLLLMWRLGLEGGAIVHGALVAVNGRGVLLPGVSGAGKTTISGQLAQASGFEVLSDDRAAVRRTSEGYMAWGTPWPGTGGHAVNRGVPLVAIAFLAQAPSPAIVPIALRDAIARIAPVASIPWYDREGGARTFEGVAELCRRVPLSVLQFAPDPSVVPLVGRLAAAAA